jgi:hypothetical protein
MARVAATRAAAIDVIMRALRKRRADHPAAAGRPERGGREGSVMGALPRVRVASL